MRKALAALAAGSVVALAAAGQAGAAASQASDRACLGNFHSTAAQENGGVGGIAVRLVSTYHPLGYDFVSWEATTCNLGQSRR